MGFKMEVSCFPGLVFTPHLCSIVVDVMALQCATCLRAVVVCKGGCAPLWWMLCPCNLPHVLMLWMVVREGMLLVNKVCSIWSSLYLSGKFCKIRLSPG